MQLEGDNPKEDLWLLHWVKTAFNMRRVSAPAEVMKIGLAVSGGGDSMAMLHLFAACAQDQNYALSVATVDHGLRPEAQEEVAFVAEVCAKLDVPHRVLKWDDWDGKGNLQAKARDARYKLLVAWGRANTLDAIALGHTLDDLAETFLMRLSRGSGLDGLAAMEKSFKRDDMEFSRPILSLEREMLRRYLRRHSLEWKDDPSNDDTRFLRVKARKALDALAPLGIDVHQIAGAAHDLLMAKSALQHNVQARAEQIIRFEGGDVVIDVLDDALTHIEIRRRLMSAVLTWVGGTVYPPRADALFDLERKVSEKKAHTLNGSLVTKTRKELRIAREFNAVKNITCATTDLWDGRWSLDGPHGDDLMIAALGEKGVNQCPDWRDTGLPRTSLLASPAVWKGDELVAAPLAGLPNGWCATLTRSREQFLSALLSH